MTMTEAPKKNSYVVTSPIRRDGKRYEVGDTIKLTEEEAQPLAKRLTTPDGRAVGEMTIPLEASDELRELAERTRADLAECQRLREEAAADKTAAEAERAKAAEDRQAAEADLAKAAEEREAAEKALADAEKAQAKPAAKTK